MENHISERMRSVRELIEKLKSVGFFERVFRWKRILSDYVFPAHADLAKLEALAEDFENRIKRAEDEKEKTEKENIELKARIEEVKNVVNSKESEIEALKKDKEMLNKKISDISSDLARYKEKEKKMEEEFLKKMATLDATKEHFEKERERISREREEEKAKQEEERKRRWKTHEISVEETIKNICKRNMIKYVSKSEFPYKGAPDSCVRIADEYIIFDAKAPTSDSLPNFKNYVKVQAEQLKKYAKYPDVKKDMFLVVPSDTINMFSDKYMDLSDYRVYIISADAVEPVLRALKEIEKYEFAEKLSPEDRETIMRVIGRFANTAKRRMQIDYFFAEQTIKDLMECNYLPDDIKEGAVRVERAGKINPPQQRRAKEISITTLLDIKKKLKKEADMENINTDSGLEKIEEIPLDRE